MPGSARLRTASLGRPGQHIGSWRLVQRLAEAPPGTWLAVDPRGRSAALQLLDDVLPPTIEVRAALVHPDLGELIDHGDAEQPFIAFRAPDGHALSRRLAGPAAPAWVAGLGARLFDALAHLHGAGLTHGSIRPEAIFVGDGSGRSLTLVDLGEERADHRWRAPEEMHGLPGAPADVFRLARVLCWLLEGADRNEPPTPGWLAQALERALQPDPDARPSAAWLSDTLAATGLPQPAPSVAQLHRRSRGLYLARPGECAQMALWLDRGGVLAIAGPPGSGRSRLLRRLASQLTSRELPLHRIYSTSVPWGGVRHLVQDESLYGLADPDARAELLGDRLAEQREAAFLVDDWEELDQGARRVVEALARRNHPRLVVTCREAPAWAQQRLSLGPFPLDLRRRWLSALLRPSAPIPVLDAWLGQAPQPGDLLRSTLHAVAAGALRWQEQGRCDWSCDTTRLPRAPLTPCGLPAWLGPEELQLGAILGAHAMPLGLDALGHLSGLAMGPLSIAIGRLAETGLIQPVGDAVGCADRQAARLLAPAPGSQQAQALSRRLFHWLEQQPRPPIDRLAWHLVGCADPALARARGPGLVQALLEREPEEAARLADALLALGPSLQLGVVGIRALIQSGQPQGAEERLQQLLPSAQGAERIPLLLLGASLLSQVHHRLDEARSLLNEAERLLDGADPPVELLLLDLQIAFRSGQRASLLARVVALQRRPPPRDPGLVDTWLRLQIVIADSLYQFGQKRQALALLEAVPDDLGLGRPARALLAAGRSRLLWLERRHREAALALEPATRSTAGLPPLDRGRVLNNLGALRHSQGQLAAAVRAWEEAQRTFLRLGAELELVRVRCNLCAGYRCLGRWEQAHRAGRQALASASRLEMSELRARTAHYLADLEMTRDNLGAAERLLHLAAHEIQQAPHRHLKPARLRRRAELAALREEPELLELAQLASHEARNRKDHEELGRARALSALGHALAGDSDACRVAMGEAVSVLVSQGADAALAHCRLWLARASLALDHNEAARSELDRALAYAEEFDLVDLRLSVERLYSQLPRHHHGCDASLLQVLELATRLSSPAPLEQLLDELAETACQLLCADRAFVLLGESAERIAGFACVTPERADARPPSRSIIERTLRFGRPVIAPDIRERGDLREMKSIIELSVGSVLCTVMRDSGGQTLGVLYLDSRRPAHEASAAARKLRALASLATVSLSGAQRSHERVQQDHQEAELAAHRRSQAELTQLAVELSEKNRKLQELNQELHRSTLSDSLTGAWNRRAFTTRIEQLAARGFALLVGDVDHFKQFNDTWGHQVGDEVLVAAVRAMRGALRDDDRVFRIGGEEFAILLLDANPLVARAVAQRVRRAVTAAGSRLPSFDTPVTMSFGVAIHRQGDDRSWEEVLRSADRALYRAKRGGRNRVELEAPRS